MYFAYLFFIIEFFKFKFKNNEPCFLKLKNIWQRNAKHIGHRYDMSKQSPTICPSNMGHFIFVYNNKNNKAFTSPSCNIVFKNINFKQNLL
jgi:hypothetical protein